VSQYLKAETKSRNLLFSQGQVSHTALPKVIQLNFDLYSDKQVLNITGLGLHIPVLQVLGLLSQQTYQSSQEQSALQCLSKIGHQEFCVSHFIKIHLSTQLLTQSQSESISQSISSVTLIKTVAVQLLPSLSLTTNTTSYTHLS
jgi:hypothetical protein